MTKTKQGGLISLVVVVTILLSMVMVPVGVVADDGIRGPLEDGFRRGGGEKDPGEKGFTKAPASAPDGGSGNIVVTGPVDTLWCEEVSGDAEIFGAAPWRDLDGDGRADVVVVTQEDLGDSQYLITIIAKNGSTGRHLWEQSLTLEGGYMYALPGADLDGDGCEDLLVHLVYHPADKQERWTVIAKSGRTGQHLWEESITDSYSDMRAYPAGDLDGDGRGDVLVWTYRTSGVGQEYKLIAKKGYDGQHLWEEASKDADVTSFNGYPVKADLDGDGRADVMVSIYRWVMAGYELTLIAKSGYDGHHLWEQTVTADYIYVQYSPYDLNGDGCPDVLLKIREGTTYTLIAKNGSSGEHLWERTFPNNVVFYSTRAGDLNGDGREDFFVGQVITTPAGNRGKATALNGSSGVTLWEQTFEAASGVYYGTTGDLDGDGKADALVAVDEPLGGDIQRSTVIAKKGNTGEHLWEESITGESARLSASGYAGDLDGDGRNDVLVFAWVVPSPGTHTETLIAKNGANGAHLWEESLTGTWQDWLDWDPLADLDCDGGLDMLVLFKQYYSTGTEKIIAKNGGTGQHLWEIQADGAFDAPLLTFTTTGCGTYYFAQPNYRLQRFDLNGDGMNDIVVWTEKKLCAIAPPPCPSPPGVPPPPPPPPPPALRVSPSPPHLPPADLRLNNISVSPDQTQAGQPVTVLANVVNNGTSSGSYNVALRINGKVEQQRTVEVSPGTAYPVKFTVTKTQPGTYNVAIEGRRASFTVIGGDSASAPASGGLIALIVIAVLILATAVVLMIAFRRPA